MPVIRTISGIRGASRKITGRKMQIPGKVVGNVFNYTGRKFRNLGRG